MALWTVKKAPLKLIFEIWSKIISSMCSMVRGFEIPALTTRMSILLNRSTVCLYSRPRSDRFVTSPRMARVPFPMVWAAWSKVFWLRPKMTTLAGLELLGSGQTDTAVTSRDNGYFIFELHGHIPFLKRPPASTTIQTRAARRCSL